jgi:quinolinate synthase
MNTQVIDQQKLQSEIRRLKREKNVILLAHYYQQAEIQDLADYVGDSLGLSQCAASVKAETIVFAGVHFMAQTAKILNPSAKVLLPDLAAGCSLADSCQPADFATFLTAHPGHTVITYINCSAEIKAMSDIICTSANAEKIVRSIPLDQPIIFAPDKNLGRYLIRKTGRNMVLWDGACVVHEAFSIEKLLKLHQDFPDARIVAHPESETHLLQVAHYVGSTTGMIDYVKKHDSEKYIIATEAGILHAMQKEVPDKILIPAPSHENNTCACSECGFMKKNTLAKLLACMVHESPVIEVEESLRLKALIPMQRMLEISKN